MLCDGANWNDSTTFMDDGTARRGGADRTWTLHGILEKSSARACDAFFMNRPLPGYRTYVREGGDSRRAFPEGEGGRLSFALAPLSFLVPFRRPRHHAFRCRCLVRWRRRR